MTSRNATSWSILRFQATKTLPLMTSVFSCIVHEGLMCLFIVHVYDQWITSNFPCKWHRTTSTTSGWKSSRAKIFHRNSSGERRLKFIASGEDSKKPRSVKAQRRQRRQNSDHKHVQRQWQNTTITLQMKPMKRGNTDCRRFKKPWGDQAMLAVYSKIIFLDATISSNSYTICTMHSSFCDTRTSSL